MMAMKKEVWKKGSNGLEFVGYLPTEDIVSASEYLAKVSDIIDKIGAKADTFGVGGTGLTFNNRFIEIDTDVMATKEWVKSQGYSSDSIVNQQIEDLQHEVTTNSANIATNKASIASLTSDVANRYTKGETDRKLDEKMKYMQTVQRWEFSGNGQYNIVKVATIKLVFAYCNMPIVFEVTGRDMAYPQTVSVYPQLGESTTSNYSFELYKTTGDYDWVIQNEGNGLGALYCKMPQTWGNLTVNRVYGRGVAYHTVTMVMAGADSFPTSGFVAKNIITALYADSASKATTADTADKGTTLYMPRKDGLSPDSMTDGLAPERVRALETNNGTSIGNLGINWWHVFTNYSQDPEYGSQFAFTMASTDTPYFAFRNRQYGSWKDWAVAITDKTIGEQTAGSYKYGKGITVSASSVNDTTNWGNALFPVDWDKVELKTIRTLGDAPAGMLGGWSIGVGFKANDVCGVITLAHSGPQMMACGARDYGHSGPAWSRNVVLTDNGDSSISSQTVKSFTATEVDHGCKFNGDLQSTSLTTSPMHVATSEFTVSPDNQPNAERTKQGNIEVTFGSVKKTIHMKYNPFMEYFFKHGYHFSAVKEGGDSTLYDRGIVTYGNFIYYCVYTYRSEDDDDFAAAIIATDDTEDMSKYVMSQGGSASELQIIGNYFRTNDLKKVNIQEKAGTLALIGDFYDKLDSKATDKALSANQGRVLDERISSLNSSVDSKIGKIKFSGLATNVSIGDIGASNSRGDEDLSYSARVYGGTYGRFYVFSGFENGHNSDYGKLVVKTSSTGKADMTTNMVAGVSGETGYWNPQWLSVSVFVPAGQYYYLWGCRITKVYYSCIELVH